MPWYILRKIIFFIHYSLNFATKFTIDVFHVSSFSDYILQRAFLTRIQVNYYSPKKIYIWLIASGHTFLFYKIWKMKCRYLDPIGNKCALFKSVDFQVITEIKLSYSVGVNISKFILIFNIWCLVHENTLV